MALDGLVGEQVEQLLRETDRAKLPLDAQPMDGPAVLTRVNVYEAAIADLAGFVALIGRWGLPDHFPSLGRVLTHIGDAADDATGYNAWIALNWLPFFVLHYSAGVAAVAAGRYDVLSALYAAPVGRRSQSDDPTTAVARAVARMVSAGRDEIFKLLPDLDDRKTPVSDYLLGFLERHLKTVIPFRAEFETVFDRFEVIDVLTTYSRQTDEKRVWSPPGRFIWKSESYGGGPFSLVQTEAKLHAEGWAPTKAGLFGGSSARFIDLAEKYRAEYFNRFGQY
jgi:hypothetical protein